CKNLSAESHSLQIGTFTEQGEEFAHCSSEAVSVFRCAGPIQSSFTRSATFDAEKGEGRWDGTCSSDSERGPPPVTIVTSFSASRQRSGREPRPWPER